MASESRIGKYRALLVTLVLLHTAGAFAEDRPYSPYSSRSFPQNLYWGDLHLHSSLSADAYFLGNTTLDPDVAYRHAKGEVVQSTSGQPFRLARPLDFLLISDHASYLGVLREIARKSDPEDAETRNTRLREALLAFLGAAYGDSTTTQDQKLFRTEWLNVTASADHHNDPGRFTAFIGYEWTSMAQGNNLHRNVLFRDGAEKANEILPFSTLDSLNPEDLWDFMAQYEEKTGGQVLAIPHNGNLSNGAMFSDKTFDGNPLTSSYAETRMRWEPLYETTQEKGDGESHPYLSPADEFADFENWDWSNIRRGGPLKEPWMLKHEYSRSAYKLGLELSEKIDVNPFKFGLVGASDSHISISAVEENNFFGKYGADEPNPNRSGPSDFVFPPRQLAASGYTAIWAEENTREALFDAMKRKETYATTGTRIMVRFFGGWSFDSLDHQRPDYAAIGYEKGVPMGGNLTATSEQTAPTFLVVASKDPMGANLDRIQIIKGWLDEHGESKEKVYDVALSDGRRVNRRTGQAPALKSTVDLGKASYTNSVGAAQLGVVWQDPDFDPEMKAFYYVRVLEIKTPRWSTYDAAYFGLPIPEVVPPVIQDRAYSSPIWYTP